MSPFPPPPYGPPPTVTPRLERMFSARDVPALLDALVRSDPGRPRLTWYGSPDERVELSARVLANWVAKTANLLTEEFDAAPGVRLALRTPAAHWKSLVLTLAVHATGASPGAQGEIVVAADPPADLVVALPALARRHPGDIGSALDYAAVVTGYDDVFLPTSPDTAWLEQVRRTLPPREGERRLVTADEAEPAARLASVLLGDGSLVVSPADADLEHLAAQEGAVR